MARTETDYNLKMFSTSPLTFTQENLLRLFCSVNTNLPIRIASILQPSEKPEMKYLQRLEELKLTNQKHLPDLGDDNFEKIMYKIKSRVMKERMRLSEFFKDYDKLRTGRVLKTVFPRAMDLSSLKLTKVEVQQLMDR